MRFSRRYTVTRQVLTARRGQRPTAWIDWDAMRSTILTWSGYAVVAVTRLLPPAELRVLPCPAGHALADGSSNGDSGSDAASAMT